MPYFLFVTSLRYSTSIATFACLGDKRACTYRNIFNNSPFGTKGDFGCLESSSLTHSVNSCDPSFSSCKLSAVVLRLDSSSLVHRHYSQFHSLAQVLIEGQVFCNFSSLFRLSVYLRVIFIIPQGTSSMIALILFARFAWRLECSTNILQIYCLEIF
jgi:hypothetical protein